MSEYLPGIIWLAVLLVVNAFFVGAEFAVISARRSQIEPKAEAGSKAAKTTLWAMEHATLMLATSQLGITVCSLVILNVSEPAIHHLLEIPLGLTSLSGEAIGIIAFVTALLLVTFLHVVLGRNGPEEHLVLRSHPGRAHPGPAAGDGGPDLQAGHLDAERDRELHPAAFQGGAQGRGHQRLHPGRGGEHRGAVHPRRHADGHQRHPDRGVRIHGQDRGGRRGAHQRDGAPAGVRHSGRHPARRARSTATPATSSPTTTACPPATCTSRTSWT